MRRVTGKQFRHLNRQTKQRNLQASKEYHWMGLQKGIANHRQAAG